MLTTGSSDPLQVNVYFAGKLIWEKANPTWAAAVVQDRLGSVVALGDGWSYRYFPYGEEATPTSEDHTKFATYYRDQTTALDYARNRYYSTSIARFTTPDPFGPSARLSNPQSWNRYSYVGNNPINFNDPLGLCPPGMVEADSPQDVDLILRTARSYLGPKIPHSGGGHYTTDAGTLTGIDCSQLVMQALAGIPWSDPFRPAAITNLWTGNIGAYFSPEPASTFRVGDIITFSDPKHMAIATGVDAEGSVTSFIGSQTTRGPQEVTNAQENKYWGPKLRNAGTAAYSPCVPANRHSAALRSPDGPDLIVGGLASGVPWWISSMYAFEGWLRSISIGVAASTIVYPGGSVTSSISYLYLVGK